MLGRSAEDLFWMARYIERAENMARLLEVGYRLVLVPRLSGQQEEWRSTLRSAGCEESYFKKYPSLDTTSVVNYLLLDQENPSSVYSCLATARRNARAQRTSLTRDMWECLNSAWIEFSSTAAQRTASTNQLPELFDWIKERSALFRGALMNTILRNDTYYFSQLGTFLERADNTARILDVKYYVLLPQIHFVGGGMDNVQWQAILRSVSAHRGYRWVYRDGFKPWNIADYLILNRQMPRSLHSCYEEIAAALVGLESHYGELSRCRGSAQEVLQWLAGTDIETVFQAGLHEFLRDFLARNNLLGAEISSIYHFNN